MNINLIEKLKKNKVLPIIRSKDPQDVINKVNALIDGGLDVGKIADCVLFAYNMPQDICVREIVVAKTKQQD